VVPDRPGQEGGRQVPALPSVSVCIPVYNGERYLAETVRSVLDQTFRDFELVVLDNASTDDSGGIARSFRDPRIRIETNSTTLPQVENWRAATTLCRAPLIKVLCDDDLLHPRCLEYQVGPMEADPGLAVVAARRHMIDERSRVLVPRRGLRGLTGVRSSVEVARQVVRSGANPIGESNGVLFRREHYVAVGGWGTEWPRVFDLDLWIRLLEYGEFLGLPETLAAFRIAGGTISAANDGAIYAEQKAYIEELARSPHLQVRGVDLAVGRLAAPLGRLRRRALYGLSHRSARRDERLLDRAAGRAMQRADKNAADRNAADRKVTDKNAGAGSRTGDGGREVERVGAPSAKSRDVDDTRGT
jgi:glycosyltransferase involved in cell wall biosynthesis